MQTWLLLEKVDTTGFFIKSHIKEGNINELYLKFQNIEALSVSVGSSYSVDQLIYIFLDNFHRGGNFSAQIASHYAELRREETFTDQKYLFISSLQTYYLNLYSSSCFGRNSEIVNTSHTKCTFGGSVNHSA